MQAHVDHLRPQSRCVQGHADVPPNYQGTPWASAPARRCACGSHAGVEPVRVRCNGAAVHAICRLDGWRHDCRGAPGHRASCRCPVQRAACQGGRSHVEALCRLVFFSRRSVAALGVLQIWWRRRVFLCNVGARDDAGARGRIFDVRVFPRRRCVYFGHG